MPVNPIVGSKNCEESPIRLVQPLPRGVSAGGQVVVRGAVSRLDATVAHEDCCELRLVVGPHRRRVLLWPFDRPTVVECRRRLRVVRLSTWTRAVGGAIASTIDPLTPRAAPRDVEVIPYQLAPAIAMATGADRVILADEVGLGKTIQAGWIVADLVARDGNARIVLAVPASVRRQWIDELARRFGLDAIDVDARWMRAIVADLPIDVSPWAAPGIYAVSIDFLKRPDVVPSMLAHAWDAIVVDEAHTAAAPTDRYTAVAALARRARRVVLVTATPYSGDAAAFTSMTHIGAADSASPPLMFRRFREDVGDPRRRRHRFATVRLTRAETQLQRLLERYSGAVWNGAVEDLAHARLAVTILRKRALSSAFAVARSLRRRRDLLSSRADMPRQLGLFDERDEVDDEVPAAALAAPGLADPDVERRWLDELIAAADAAFIVDSKLRYLRRLLHRLPGEPAVVFTEYRDTLGYLSDRLPPSIHLHGGMTPAERADVQQRFNREGGLLLATDAAAEGLNLHGHCRLVVNYELPWSPARLEQRIGRVDRIGQRHTVHAITLTARDTAEDLVLANLARRVGRVVATLGTKGRMRSFVDEARVASLVIGGAEPDVDAVPPSAVVRAQPVDNRTHDAAAVLRSIARQRPDTRSRDISVGDMRANGALAPGYVVVLATTARTADGAVVARRIDAVHAPAEASRPLRHSDARRTAARLLDSLELPPSRLASQIDGWVASVRDTHERAIDAALARERSLHDQTPARGGVQPGLFDRRALDAEARRDRIEIDLTAEHGQHRATLERERPLSLVTEPVAVLIGWR
jgi:superfamily II DNA or RNA helicase